MSASGGAPKLKCPRVLIAAEHASIAFGGEAALPLHYYRVLRHRGEDVRLLVHSRTRAELSTAFPGDDRILYVEDTAADRLLHQLGQWLPNRLSWITTGFLMRVHTQLQQRRKIKDLVRSGLIDIVHQPMPVSPREPSLLSGLGVPVVIGPMNGGMRFPDAFRRMDSIAVRLLIGSARHAATVLNVLMPGKRQAAVLLVANARTAAALPCRGRRVVEMVENGVDFSVWTERHVAAAGTAEAGDATEPRAARFVYMGRLVDWKAVDLLITAFERAAARAGMSLTILGDGEERAALEAQARQLGLFSPVRQPGRIDFAGWKTQAECAAVLADSDALVLPSLYECGGAVVLEAMAMGKAVLATRWGGPADYLDETCGVMIEPESREGFVKGLEDGLVRLALSPEERGRLGENGRVRARKEFDWDVKTDRMIGIYRAALAG